MEERRRIGTLKRRSRCTRARPLGEELPLSSERLVSRGVGDDVLLRYGGGISRCYGVVRSDDEGDDEGIK